MSLSNIKVLDLTRILAGPYCTQLLADLGARVTKLESLSGDDTRTWGPPFLQDGGSCYFGGINRNKRSVAVDIKKDLKDGGKILERLIEDSDVVVHNFLPKSAGEHALLRSLLCSHTHLFVHTHTNPSAANLGLSYDAVRSINPNIVYCAISGFGTLGIYAGRGGYDVIVSGMYGLMDITGNEADEVGVKCGVAVTDVMTGVVASQAIVSKLYERDVNPGQVPFSGEISCSLMETQLSMLSNVASSTLNTPASTIRKPRYGNAHESVVPYETFVCQDGRSMVVAGANDKQFANLCDALELTMEEEWRVNKDRVTHRDGLIAAMTDTFIQRTRDEWTRHFETLTMTFPYGPVRSVEEAFDCQQVKDNDVVVTVAGKTPEQSIRMVKHPATHTGVIEQFKYPPMLGEHTRDVLKEAEFTDAEIDALFDRNVVK